MQRLAPASRQGLLTILDGALYAPGRPLRGNQRRQRPDRLLPEHPWPAAGARRSRPSGSVSHRAPEMDLTHAFVDPDPPQGDS